LAAQTAAAKVCLRTTHRGATRIADRLFNLIGDLATIQAVLAATWAVVVMSPQFLAQLRSAVEARPAQAHFARGLVRARTLASRHAQDTGELRTISKPWWPATVAPVIFDRNQQMAPLGGLTFHSVKGP